MARLGSHHGKATLGVLRRGLVADVVVAHEEPNLGDPRVRILVDRRPLRADRLVEPALLGVDVVHRLVRGGKPGVFLDDGPALGKRFVVASHPPWPIRAETL
jgi:hypothetical protein